MKDIKIQQTKNFGAKKLENVLLYDRDGKIKNLMQSLESDILNSEFTCICAAEGLSDSVMNIIQKCTNPEFRCYILVKNIDKNSWDNHPARDYCIIHQVPDLNGNYVLTKKKNDKTVYFLNKNGEGIAFCDDFVTEKIMKVFINEFWTHANKEYVCGFGDVKERTFDIPPVKSDADLILNQGVETDSLLKKEFLNAAEIFFASPFDPANFTKLKTVYFKNIPQQLSTLGKLYQSKIEADYVSGFCLNFVKTEDNMYITNFDVSKTDLNKRDNRLFMLRISQRDFLDGIAGKVYKFMPEISYTESVEKDILGEGGHPVKISLQGSREYKKTRAVDVREAQKNGNSYQNWESFLDKESVFTTDQKAVSVEFEITIPVRKKTFTTKAAVYDQYTKSDEAVKSAYEKGKNKIEVFEKKISRKLIEIDKNSKKVTEKNNKAEYQKTIEKYSAEKNAVAAEQKKIEDLKKLYLKYSDFSIPSKSVNDVKANYQKLSAACVLIEEEARVKIPDFDKPRYGELFQQGSSFEYVVKDVNLKDAEEEIQSWNVENISFVTDDE